MCLFINQTINIGVHVIETDESGLMWVKVCKDFFRMENIYIEFRNRHQKIFSIR